MSKPRGQGQADLDGGCVECSLCSWISWVIGINVGWRSRYQGLKPVMQQKGYQSDWTHSLHELALLQKLLMAVSFRRATLD